MKGRLDTLRGRMAEKGIPALVVNFPPNRQYLSGFTGTAGTVLVLPDAALLLVDGRYTLQARAQAPHLEVREYPLGEGVWPSVQRLLQEAGMAALGFESAAVTVAQHQKMAETLAPIRLLPTEGLVEEGRLVKSEAEIAALARACQVTDQAFAEVLPLVKPGVREADLALELEFRMRRLGASGPAFSFIVASGERSALPHGVASATALAAGDLVIFDIGAVVDGYHSDMTRTVGLGPLPEEARQMYALVRQAQEAGLSAVRPGATGKEVDEVARSVIREAGKGDLFVHGTGHGVGLEIHEAPRLSVLGDIVLRPGMVVTVEPGIYVPGLGGVRIEDTVVVTAGAPRILTATAKDLIIL